MFEDPLAELGINFKRGYESTALIRKIRKEQRKMVDEIEKKKMEEKQNQKDEKSVKGEEYIFLKPIYAAEDAIGKVTRKTKETWAETFSPEAVRNWISTSRYMRIWMVVQVIVTILAIVNYVWLTYNLDLQGIRKYPLN